MKAMILKQFGPDAAFELAELPQPEASAGQVLVRIAATSVNPADLKIRTSNGSSPLAPTLPALLGMDFAGTVVAVGEGVDQFAIGDEVYGCAGGLADLPGTLAEYIAADARLIALKPRSLSMREAAALPLVGITAMEGLRRAKVQPGQRVLVHGGAGGVGHVAVQLAKSMGACVFATASKPQAMAIIERYGATPINHRTESVSDYVQRCTAGLGFDVVFDSVGGANMAQSFAAAALNAQVVSTVSVVDLNLSLMHFKGLSLHVVFMLIPMLHDVRRETHGEILRTLAQMVDAGALKPLIDPHRFPLEAVNAAHAHLASGSAMGKIVIEVR